MTEEERGKRAAFDDRRTDHLTFKKLKGIDKILEATLYKTISISICRKISFMSIIWRLMFKFGKEFMIN